jgi:hypothetical protein
MSDFCPLNKAEKLIATDVTYREQTHDAMHLNRPEGIVCECACGILIAVGVTREMAIFSVWSFSGAYSRGLPKG